VPVVGFELTTYRLQGDCSTPELNRPISYSATASTAGARYPGRLFNSAILRVIFITCRLRALVNSFSNCGTFSGPSRELPFLVRMGSALRLFCPVLFEAICFPICDILLILFVTMTKLIVY